MEEKQNSRNVSIVKDLNGNNIVIINDIVFKGRQNISWNDVEKYLTKYVGQFYTIADSKEVVYIGSDLPDEYAHSEYTNILKGANAKAKANAAQGLPELIEISTGKRLHQIQRVNIIMMQNMVGIGMNQDLLCLYLKMVGIL